MSALIRGKSMRLASVPTGDVGGKWNLLFPAGITRHRADFPGGELTFDEKFLSTLVDNWGRLGRPELPVDYFHRGESVNDGLPVEEKVAAGWISDLRTTPDGVEALITWTDRARGHIQADELRYLSPTFAIDAPDKLEGGMQGPTLYGAALLNDPFLTELPRVAASNTPPSPAPAATTHKEKHMALNAKAICALLGVPDDSEEGAIMEALAKKCTVPAAPAPEAQVPPAAMAALSSKAERLELANDTLKTSLSAAVKRVEELEAAAATEKMTRLCDELISAKKVLPAQREQVVAMAKATSIDDARKFFSALSTLPINTQEHGHGTGDEETTDLSQLNAEYNKELDAKLASGVKVQLASKELRALPKYRPLFTNIIEKN